MGSGGNPKGKKQRDETLGPAFQPQLIIEDLSGKNLWRTYFPRLQAIPSREVSILWSYLDIRFLFSSYVYLIFYYLFLSLPIHLLPVMTLEIQTIKANFHLHRS